MATAGEVAMDALEAWRFCNELSVVEATLLILGCDPSTYEGVAGWHAQDKPTGFDGLFTALRNDVMSKRLPAAICRDAWVRGWDEEPTEGVEVADHVRGFPGDESGRPLGTIFYRTEPNWDKTRVRVADLREWLDMQRRQGRSVPRESFFAVNAAPSEDYLDAGHPRYAPKLAATVSAWRAVGNADIRTSPKKALEQWLHANAARFNLTDPAGRVIGQAIDECAKVANWQPQGGSPKTPNGTG
jgi:hypothetical protein